MGREEPEVRFTDSAGITWRVYERDLRIGHDPAPRRCLVYDNDAVWRRVTDYPADWATLPSVALEALCWAPVRPREGAD